MKALIALKAFGLSELDAVRYYTAIIMAEQGVVSAPNMAIGQPFHIGGMPTISADGYTMNAQATTSALSPPSENSQNGEEEGQWVQNHRMTLLYNSCTYFSPGTAI